jgi:hypothetical protein
MSTISDSINEIKELITPLTSTYIRSVEEYLTECKNIVELRTQLETTNFDLKKGLLPILDKVESSVLDINGALIKTVEQKSYCSQLLEFDLPKITEIIKKYVAGTQVIVSEYSEEKSREWIYEKASDLLSCVGQVLGESNTFISRLNQAMREASNLSATFSDIYSDLMKLYEVKLIEIPKSVKLDDLDDCVSELEDLGVTVDITKKGNSYVLSLGRWDSMISKVVDKYIK